MSTFESDPVTIKLRPAYDMESLHGGHVLEIGRSHGSYRQVLSTGELGSLRDLLADYLGAEDAADIAEADAAMSDPGPSVPLEDLEAGK